MSRRILTIIVAALLALGLQAQNPPEPGMSEVKIEKSKDEIMRENDPKGLVLSFISISIVFISLFILAVIFTYIGKFQSRKLRPKKDGDEQKDISPETAAAIAMALNQEYGSEVYAAIALALNEYLSEEVHDRESYILTIKPSEHSQWKNKALNFRKSPNKS